MNIGENIRKKRLEKNMTSVQLAEKAKTTKQTIYKYEKGLVTNIPIERLKDIANALGCELYELTESNNDLVEHLIESNQIKNSQSVKEFQLFKNTNDKFQFEKMIHLVPKSLSNKEGLFVVESNDNSMNLLFGSNSFVLVESVKEISSLKHNQIVLLKDSGKLVFRRLLIGDYINLLPMSSEHNHEIYTFSMDELESRTILDFSFSNGEYGVPMIVGKAVWFCSSKVL